MGGISNRKKTDMLTYQQREPSPINIVRHVSDVASTGAYSQAYSFLMIAWSAFARYWEDN